MVTLADQVNLLGRRSVVRTIRQPANVIGPLIFPLMLLAVNSGGLRAETHLPGFPGGSMVAFLLAVPFIQGALFATMNTGTDLARDIQTGFLNRLALTPMRGSALLAGHMAGVMVLGLLQSIFYVCFALIVGVRFEAGVAGAFVILALATIIAAAFGMLGAFLALRTGSGESIQATFPFLFVFLFISSMNTPRNLIAVHWFQIAATINPVSYLIEGVRSLVITGWDATALWRAFAVALAIGTVSVVLASRALGRRMART